VASGKMGFAQKKHSKADHQGLDNMREVLKNLIPVLVVQDLLLAHIDLIDPGLI